MSERRPRARDPHTPTVEDAVTEYRKSLDSGGSRTAMKYPLEEFADYCADTLGVDRVGELDPMDLRDYGQYLKSITGTDERLAPSTANTYYDYVRSFLGFCVRSQWLETNPANTLEATELLPEDKPTRDTQVWTPEQRKQLIEYATERVELALEERIDTPRERAYRDRTIVVLLAELGVRGAELFRDKNDDERDGLRWGDVDLERGRMVVYGKSREYEAVGLTEAAHDALARLERVQGPPTDDWPVFPTDHAASKYQAVEDATGERPDPGSDIDTILREQAIAPPSITKEAGRQIMKRLTKEAGIDVESDKAEPYLEPHGARRALGAELYEQGHSELAQSALRHKSIETTHESYTDIQAEDVAESIDEVRD